MCESGLGDFLISDVQPLLLFKQCSMWLHEGLRDPEQPAIVPRTPGSLPTYPPCVDIPGFVLYQLWAVSFFVAQTKMTLISPTTTTLPLENPTRWSSAGPATNNSRTFGTTSRFHHLKPVADGRYHVGVELMDEYLILFHRSVYLGWWYTRWFQSKWEKYSRLQGYSCCRIVHLPKWR